MKTIYFAIAVIILLIIMDFWRSYKLYLIGLNIAETARLHPIKVENFDKRILIIGDSTALGVGASSEQATLVGRWANYLPNAKIDHIAQNGWRIEDITLELEKLPEEQYDVIFLHVGGNDVIRLTDLQTLESNANEMLEITKKKGNKIIWTSSGNIGSAPFFPIILRPLLSHRTRQAREIFMQSAKRANIAYVDLFTTRKNDPFRNNIREHYAADLLHPADAGYKIWFNQISAVYKANLANE
jgi:lysophospholipase L1-like esterase